CVRPFYRRPRSPSYVCTLSLHDALPILIGNAFCLPIPAIVVFSNELVSKCFRRVPFKSTRLRSPKCKQNGCVHKPRRARVACQRSEEHTSELQSRFDLVCRLLLEKMKGK